jgi:hypothetical protein
MKARSKVPAQTETAAIRRLKAFNIRLAGHSFRGIVGETGVSLGLACPGAAEGEGTVSGAARPRGRTRPVLHGRGVAGGAERLAD